jgi:hypothetical protein
MTLPVQTPINRYTYAGSSTFVYAYLILDAADLLVSVDGVPKTLGADYTVSGVGVLTGGTITYLGALTVGQIVALTRSIALQRLSDYQELGDFLAGTVNNDLDRLWMGLQDVTTTVETRALRMPVGTMVNDLPSLDTLKGNLLGFDATTGQPVAAGPTSGSVTAYALQLAGALGTAIIGHITDWVGGVFRSVQSKLRDDVNARDFGVDVAAADNAVALQAFWDACSSDTPNSPHGRLPWGTIRTSVGPVAKKQFNNISGHGKNQTVIQLTSATGDGLSTIAMTYFKPCWSDFTVDASASSGYGINLSNVTNEVYDGELARITVAAGSDGLYAPRMFSMDVRNIRSSSTNGHSFRANNGPATTWTTCYAVRCGPGKCGYRFAGETLMIGCNGLDNGERYAVFGSNPAAADGFQNDFPGLTDFPRVTMIGCNVEAYSVEAFRLHNSYRRFTFEGGKIDRSAFSSAYTSVLTVCAQGVDVNTPIRLNPSFYSPGAGVPVNGAGAQFWVQSGNVCIVDMTGDTLGQVFDSTVSGGTLVPMVHMGVVQDVFGGRAMSFNAVQAGRVVAGVLRLSPKTFAPVGASQNIDVTGCMVATVTPVAAASISTATFDTTTIGADKDVGRDVGLLYIKAGNANLTINHNGGAGVDNFIMAGAANVTLAANEVRVFLRSKNQWREL